MVLLALSILCGVWVIWDATDNLAGIALFYIFGIALAIAGVGLLAVFVFNFVKPPRP